MRCYEKTAGEYRPEKPIIDNERFGRSFHGLYVKSFDDGQGEGVMTPMRRRGGGAGGRN